MFEIVEKNGRVLKTFDSYEAAWAYWLNDVANGGRSYIRERKGRDR